VPTVREKIESGPRKAGEPKSRSRRAVAKVGSPIRIIGRGLKPIVKPLMPILRPLLKIFRRLVPRYFINSWRELRLVTWPNRRETWRLTGAVLVFAIVFGALVAVVDYGLDQIFRRLVLR
jgi:preprotein translocase SecE subunit